MNWLKVFIVLLLLHGNCIAQKKNITPIALDPLLLKADSFNLKARSYMFKGKKDSVFFYLDKSLQIAEQFNNETLQARCLVDYGGFYLLQGSYKNAELYLKKADYYFDRIDHYDIRLSILMQKATLFLITNRKDSAFVLYKKAEAFNNKYLPSKNWEVYIALGELFNQMHDDDNAEIYNKKAYQLLPDIKKTIDKIHLLMSLANYYQGKKNYTAAGPIIAQFYVLKEELKKKNIIDPLENMLMNLLDNRLETNINFMQAFKDSSLQKDNITEAIIANSYIVAYYAKRKKYDEAYKYANDGELIAAKLGNIDNLYETKKIKYNILQKAGRFDEAAKEAALLFDLKDSVLTIQKREKIYELETKYETAKKEKEIELLNVQYKLNEKEVTLLMKDKKMTQILLQNEMTMRGNLFRENILMDSIVQNEQAYNTLLTAENELKTSKLNKEVALKEALARENTLKAKELVTQRRTKWGLATGAILFLLSGVAIFALYSKQKNKNVIIQKQATDLEILMKEIHHRVKNNMQIVSSLLDLQSISIKDPQISDAVKEGKNRVQSMALIHQNLYGEDNLKGIKAKQYINNLLKNLCDSYNISNEKVKIHSNIEDLNLDVDTMIPIGLILNELLTNAFKYAFNTNTAGVLEIDLREENNQLQLSVKDNGPGFPLELDAKTTKSFGLRMIRAFAQKLKAVVEIKNNNGASVQLNIKKYLLA
jgi:two-component sensor histidine kinase